MPRPSDEKNCEHTYRSRITQMKYEVQYAGDKKIRKRKPRISSYWSG